MTPQPQPTYPLTDADIAELIDYADAEDSVACIKSICEKIKARFHPVSAPDVSNLCKKNPNITIISATLAHICCGCEYELTCGTDQVSCADHPYCTGSCSGEVDATFNCSAEQHDARVADQAREKGREEVLDYMEEFWSTDSTLTLYKWEVREVIKSLREAHR